MTLNSRGLALLLAISVAAITTLFLSLLPEISQAALFITFGLAFATSYIFVRLMAEFLFFREINNIYEALDNLRDESLSNISRQDKTYFNPLRKINRGISDYAEKKQQEIDELKRMEAFRREFIADVSHELKTPIFSAQGFVHTLLDGAVEDKRVRTKFLKKAAKSLDGLDILVQELLTISQMETGEIKMHYENFDIVDLLHEIIDQLEDKAKKKKIKLEFEEKYEQPVFVYADYQRIYQVMTNLITNGIKYTKKDGYVHVGIKKDKKEIEISVTDNGRGIPKEDLGRIFERFYRVEKSRSKNKGGTGLGLAIVKHIMEAHDSHIEVWSEPKVGSKFWFRLQEGEAVEKIDWGSDDEDE